MNLKLIVALIVVLLSTVAAFMSKHEAQHAKLEIRATQAQKQQPVPQWSKTAREYRQ